MRHSERTHSVVVMGVSGSGKSTVGRLLADRSNSRFCDADDLHPTANIARMAAGHALGDAERMPWLRNVGETMARARDAGENLVMACSALKRSYRDMLREHVGDAFFVFLDGPLEIVHERMSARTHEFMPPSLLASQYASLEPLQGDELGMRVGITMTPEQIVDEFLTEAPFFGESLFAPTRGRVFGDHIA